MIFGDDKLINYPYISSLCLYYCSAMRASNKRMIKTLKKQVLQVS